MAPDRRTARFLLPLEEAESCGRAPTLSSSQTPSTLGREPADAQALVAPHQRDDEGRRPAQKEEGEESPALDARAVTLPEREPVLAESHDRGQAEERQGHQTDDQACETMKEIHALSEGV